jgi:hypothetical protein
LGVGAQDGTPVVRSQGINGSLRQEIYRLRERRIHVACAIDLGGRIVHG